MLEERDYIICTSKDSSVCVACEIEGKLNCRYDEDLVKCFRRNHFPFRAIQFLVIGVAALLTGLWWTFILFAAVIVLNFAVIETWYLCRHCPFYEKEGKIATITLNYPEKLNAMDFPGDGGICDSLYRDALDMAEEDDDIKVVMIKGAGRAFCAGHDLTRVGFVYGMEPGKRVGQQARLKVDQPWMDRCFRRLFLFPK